ncbi:MAG: insulinase family protein, partial [Pyrinomonadaceae bacterium]|nr:insulinase family protein [Pyrinomonadaceae bacterium]
MEDLDDATVEDVQEFFRVYYAPNNAVLVLSGSFERATAKQLVEKYFGSIPNQPLAAVLDVSEPREVSENYKVYEDKLAPFPAFLIGWKIPPRRSPEFYALYLAGKLLYDGESSRLYQKLVKGEESIVQLFGFTDERRGPSSMFIGAIPKPEKDLSVIREVIMREINDLAINGVTADEMQKLQNQLLNDVIRMRQSSMARAQHIAEFTLYDGNPELVNSELDELLKITPEQIKTAVAEFLNTENRALLDVVPVGKG